MIYETPARFRQALEARLAARAAEVKTDLGRLRRRVVFERILARLQHAAEGRWVLKGGMALELRLGDKARATKDLDLTLREVGSEPEEVRWALVSALTPDPFADGFGFRVPQPRALEPDAAGRPGWRFAIDSRLAGRSFAKVRVDVVVRGEEIAATETLTQESLLAFAGIPAFEVLVVDCRQHFAEKLHALTRSYRRPNSRSRDVPDLLLLIHMGLAPDPALHQAVEHVFLARDTHPMPRLLPDPPPSWRREYAKFAEELDLPEVTLEEAMITLRRFWGQVPRSQEGA